VGHPAIKLPLTLEDTVNPEQLGIGLNHRTTSPQYQINKSKNAMAIRPTQKAATWNFIYRTPLGAHLNKERQRNAFFSYYNN
jgi:hypothetical protein